MTKDDVPLFSFLAFIGGAVVGGVSIGASAGNQVWAGVVGAIAGGLIGIVSGVALERSRRTRELDELKASLYAEIADRAGRCANDYIRPWRNWTVMPSNPVSAERIRNFRVAPPVVFPAIAGRLGSIEAPTLLPVTQFYYRLEAVAQAIESFVIICEQREQSDRVYATEVQDQRRVNDIGRRFRSCFEPAALALDRLEPSVPEASDFDREVCSERVYPNLAGEAPDGQLRAVLARVAAEA
jgi:hypothetical protein